MLRDRLLRFYLSRNTVVAINPARKGELDAIPGVAMWLISPVVGDVQQWFARVRHPVANADILFMVSL
jgi:hypothetical protein